MCSQVPPPTTRPTAAIQEFLTEEAPRCATISCSGAKGSCKTPAGGEAVERQLQKHRGCGPVKELREHFWD